MAAYKVVVVFDSPVEIADVRDLFYERRKAEKRAAELSKISGVRHTLIYERPPPITFFPWERSQREILETVTDLYIKGVRQS